MQLFQKFKENQKMHYTLNMYMYVAHSTQKSCGRTFLTFEKIIR